MIYKKKIKVLTINTEVLENKVNQYIWGPNLTKARTTQEAKDIVIVIAGLIVDRTNPVIQELEQVLELIDKNGYKIWSK